MGYIDYLEKIEEDAEKLRQLTGFSLSTLVELFAAGYTLKAPKSNNESEELNKVVNKRYNSYRLCKLWRNK